MKFSKLNIKHILLLIIMCCQGIASSGCSTRELHQSTELRNEAAEQVSVGMSRANVAAKIEDMAWRRYTCETETWLRDVYLFGSKNVDNAGILILDYELEAGQTTLKRISSFENYMLDSVTSSCEVVTL